MKTGLGIIAAFALALFATQAQAQSDFDAKAQQVCGNDVFRLCGDAVPDRGRIEACMRRKFSQVSAPCRQLMAGYGRGRQATGHRPHSSRHAPRRHHYTSRHHSSHHATRHHKTRHHHEYSDRR